ncbi:hypothetical protein V6N13_085486 [Hibiscus sabdariffa]|uniref:Uncharacterized protein n=1 Tax=Hibiscus sabdariffa TaxID=183260 RepID=A0ABR2D1S0_9ROSI
MAEITFVVFSFALLLSSQFAVGHNEQIKDFVRQEATTAGDASKSTQLPPVVALSPKQEGRLFSTMLFTPLLEMADVGLITIDDAKKVASSPAVQARLAKFIEEAKFNSKDNIDVVLSDDDEERYLSTMFFWPLMQMTDDGLIDPAVLKKVVSSSEIKSKLAQFIEKARTVAKGDSDGKLSPKSEERYFTTIFLTPMMALQDAGLITPDVMKKMISSSDAKSAISQYVAKAKEKYDIGVAPTPAEEDSYYDILLFTPIMKMAEAGVLSPEVVQRVVASPVTKSMLSHFVKKAETELKADNKDTKN